MIIALARFRAWRARHPWLELLLVAALLLLALTLLASHVGFATNLLTTVAFVAVTLLAKGVTLLANYARYRTFSPSPERVREAEAEVDRIAAQVREQRARDARNL
jgi:predicted tellurium resistance membrane protein TerC